jgi:hypothetical protein
MASTSALVMAVLLTLATEFSGVATMPALVVGTWDLGASGAGRSQPVKATAKIAATLARDFFIKDFL